MSFSNVEHFATIVAGCESINNHSSAGIGLNAEGEYAFAVLKLHAQDAGFIAGQEGFLDAIKKGAKTAKEFLKALIQAVRDWLNGISRDNRARINEIDTLLKKINWEEFDATPYLSAFTTPIDGSKHYLEGIPAEKLTVGNKKFDVKDITNHLDAALKAINENRPLKFSSSLAAAFYASEGMVKDFTTALDQERNKLKDDEPLPKELTAASAGLKELSKQSNYITTLLGRSNEAVSKAYGSWSTKHKANQDRHRDLHDEKAKLEKGNKK